MGLNNFAKVDDTKNPTFEESLREGKKVEMAVLSWIKKDYPQAHITEGKFKDYDILIPEINKTVEVKADFMSVKTGRFVIEISMGGKPSGLSSTRSDYWILCDGEVLITTTPSILRELIVTDNLNPVKFTAKGDKKTKTVYLVPVDKLIETSLHHVKYVRCDR